MSVAPQIASPRFAAENSGLQRAATRAHLYVSNLFDNTVTVYAQGKTSVRRAISQGVNYPFALAFYASNNLYVANTDGGTYTGGNMPVYASGGGSVPRTISQGINIPAALACDGSGNLYVANNPKPPGSVTVYAPDSGSVLRTISQGVTVPSRLAFDSSGNLYVANYSGSTSTATVHAPGSGSVLRTIFQKMLDPDALAFDSFGNLYVANVGFNTATVYASGGTSLLRTISEGVSGPTRWHSTAPAISMWQTVDVKRATARLGEVRHSLCARQQQGVADDLERCELAEGAGVRPVSSSSQHR
jgi:DNA-binding beta-propeller fold protein YncE